MSAVVASALSYAATPLARVAQSLVIALLKHVARGRLRVVTPSGRTYVFPDPVQPKDDLGDDGDELEAELKVVNDAFWIRVAVGGDIGFAEAYMFGDVECPDLTALFKLYIANRAHLSALRTPLSLPALLALPQRLLSALPFSLPLPSLSGPSLETARQNIAAHYDLSDRMFAAFLSRDMTYSCAIFPSLDGDLQAPTSTKPSPSPSRLALPFPIPSSPTRSPSPTSGSTTPSTPTLAPTPPLPTSDPLEHAQLTKLHHIALLADVRPHQRVLEIGSGWGSLTLLLARLVRTCTIDTLTLSTSQHASLSARIDALGLADRVRVHLMDYRAMPASWRGTFHRVVSVEMAEAVGRALLPSYFSALSLALHPTEGAGVIQCITIPDARLATYSAQPDFIQKYIFPGGFLPSLSLLVSGISETEAGGGLVVEKVENVGPHYARTLREWRARFEAAFDGEEGEIRRALREDEGMGEQEVEVFRRKWVYYYCYCEAGFATRTLNDHIITFSREGNVRYKFDLFE